VGLLQVRHEEDSGGLLQVRHDEVAGGLLQVGEEAIQSMVACCRSETRRSGRGG
jgi:hypothetical protein